MESSLFKNHLFIASYSASILFSIISDTSIEILFKIEIYCTFFLFDNSSKVSTEYEITGDRSLENNFLSKISSGFIYRFQFIG